MSTNPEIDQLYTERAIAAVLAVKMALKAGFKAGVGWDDNAMAKGQWETLLFADFPGGQISWHIAHHDRHLLVGIPFYEGVGWYG